MISEPIVELVASKVVFYSQNDESAFFEWLKKLKALNRFEGNGSDLYIYINRSDLDDGELREILSLFRRYDVQLAQLSVFDTDEFSSWFRNKKAYWYKPVFESEDQ